MNKAIGILGGLVALAVLLLALQNPTGSANVIESNNGTIEVSGFGKVSVEPDEGHVVVSVEVESKTASGAADQNAVIVNRVITKIKSVGVEKVETKSYRVEPIYQWVEEPIEQGKEGVTKRSVIIGYKARTTLEIVAQPGLVGKVIDAAMSGGANRIDSVFFTLSENSRKSAYEKALRKAVEDAENKTRVVAEELGIGNYRISKVVVGYGYIPRSIEAKTTLGRTTIIPSEVEVTATVNLVYEI